MIKNKKQKLDLPPPERGFWGIIRRMADLWRQRKFVRSLKELEYQQAEQDCDQIFGGRDETTAYYGTGTAWVLENDVLKKLIKENNATSIHDWKKVLNSCIPKFVHEKENENYYSAINSLQKMPENDEWIALEKKMNNSANTSKRFIRVSDGEGENLLNRR